MCKCKSVGMVYLVYPAELVVTVRLRTVVVSKNLTLRSISTIILPFYTIVFCKVRAHARIFFMFACMRLIGRRDPTAITTVMCHVQPRKLAVKKQWGSKAQRGIILTNQGGRRRFYVALL